MTKLSYEKAKETLLKSFPYITLTRQEMVRAYHYGWKLAINGNYNNTKNIGDKKERTEKECAYDFFIGKAAEMAAKKFADKKYSFYLGEVDFKIRTKENYDHMDFTPEGFNIDVKVVRHYHKYLTVKKDSLDNKVKSGVKPDFFIAFKYVHEPNIDGNFYFMGYATYDEIINDSELKKTGETFCGEIINEPIYVRKLDLLHKDFGDLIAMISKGA